MPVTRRADRDRKAALDAYVAALVAQAPPLRPEQIDRIAALLKPSTAAVQRP